MPAVTGEEMLADTGATATGDPSLVAAETDGAISALAAFIDCTVATPASTGDGVLVVDLKCWSRNF